MAQQPSQYMIAVLPHCLGHHNRRIGMNVRKDIHAHALV